MIRKQLCPGIYLSIYLSNFFLLIFLSATNRFLTFFRNDFKSRYYGLDITSLSLSLPLSLSHTHTHILFLSHLPSPLYIYIHYIYISHLLSLSLSIYIYIYIIYIYEIRSNNSKPHPPKSAIDEHFSCGNTQPLPIKLEKSELIFFLVL